ncbi:MAG: polyamine ABC transporter ATP-binding protein [Gammaproteobacteria bacterium]|nr:polyamine ABC transporter ATP-binding protein [Gammaproteobacteria bacterium]
MLEPSAQKSVAPATDKPAMDKPTGDDAYIRIEGVTKKFDGFVAVNNVSLDIPKGEIFALLGSSGCGKSTLLRMLAGFENPTSGRITIDGQDMAGTPPYIRPTNMMFQSYALFPHMSVWDNVAFGLKQDKVPADEIEKRVKELLDLVHMGQYAKRKPHQLSGGQRQRVALARSLAKRPKLLLLDEPMGALDKKLRERMQLEVVDIIEKVGVTCVMVTHDQEEAMTMASRIAIMSEGRILQIGKPREIYEYPNCRFTAEFIGSVNIFEGKLDENENEYVTVACPDLPAKVYVDHGISGHDNIPVWVAVRPEKICIERNKPGEDYNWAKGVVKDIAYLGDISVYHVLLPGGKKILATLANMFRYQKEEPPTWGDEVYVSWLPSDNVVVTS